MKHLPTILSGLRLAATAPLLALAWFGEAAAFLIVLLLAIVSDGIDGWIARRFDAYSALGVRLDSLADYAIYIIVPLGGWWLWPELVTREAFWFGLVVIGYALPGAVLVLFAGGPAWPLHIAAPIALLAGIEQTLITLVADRPRDDLPSIVHALRTRGRHA